MDFRLVTKKSQKGNTKTGVQASVQASEANKNGNIKGQNVVVANSFATLQNVDSDSNHENNNSDVIRDNRHAYHLRQNGDSSSSVS